MRSTLALFLCLLLPVAYGAPRLKFGKTVLTGHSSDDSKVDLYGGIPFAEPPLGQLRFRSPVLKHHLTSPTFDAGQLGKSCLQPPLVINLTDMSDDCLTINIYRPAGVKLTEKLPVLFWTYGGAWTFGASSLTDGSGLVARSVERGTPIIYVSFNYRLGPFGFPQGQEAEDQGVLNLGLEDQIAALKWVQWNIHYFGGDKDKVTAFGESAGSINTAILYLDSHLDGLARAAIFQSGQANSLINPKASFRENGWTNLIKATSCASTVSSGSSLSCLRNVSTSDVYSAWLKGLLNPTDFLTIQYFPTIDPKRNSLLADLPSRLYAQGRFSRLPFISGTNLDEGTSFGIRDANFSAAGVKDHLTALNSPSTQPAALDREIDKVLETYPDIPSEGSPYGTGDELFGLTSSYKRHNSIIGDMVFTSPRRMWMKAAVSQGVKAYGYQFAQPQPLDDPSLGVYHSSEIQFVHGNPLDPSPSAKKLATVMMDYWISFTVSLDPNDGRGIRNRPTWPRYTTSNQNLLKFQENITVIADNFRQEKIAVFDLNPAIFRH